MLTSDDFTTKADHTILWLDENMAVPENNESTKEVLATGVNLTSICRSSSAERIDQLIVATEKELNINTRDRLITRPLRMFSDENECFQFIIERLAAGKKVFLITSGYKGRLIVPQIHKKLSGSIYVFCGNRQWHEQWSGPYEQDIEIYDDDQGVFGKVISDIAIYYLTKGQDEQCGLTDAIQYLRWSIRLFRSATLIDKIDRADYIDIVNEELTSKEQTDDRIGEAAEEQ